MLGEWAFRPVRMRPGLPDRWCACCRHSLKLLRAMSCYSEPYMFVDVASPRWAILHINDAVTEKTGDSVMQPHTWPFPWKR